MIRGKANPRESLHRILASHDVRGLVCFAEVECGEQLTGIGASVDVALC
jgi:hypothetical protein